MGQCCARPAGAPDWQNEDREVGDVKVVSNEEVVSRMPVAPLDRSTKDAILERLHQGELLVGTNAPRGGQRVRHGSAGRFPPITGPGNRVNPADPFMPSYLMGGAHEATYEPITVQQQQERLAVPEVDKRAFNANGNGMMPDDEVGPDRNEDVPDEWNKPVDKRAMVVSYGPSGLATVTEESESMGQSTDQTPLASQAAAKAEAVVVKSVVLTGAMPGGGPVDPQLLEARLAVLEREASLQYEGEDLLKGQDEKRLEPGHWSAEDLIAKGWGVAAHRRWGSNVSDIESCSPDGKKASLWNNALTEQEAAMLANASAGPHGGAPNGVRMHGSNGQNLTGLLEKYNWEYQTAIDHSDFHRLSKEEMRIAFGEFTPGVITPYILTPGSSFSLPQHVSLFPELAGGHPSSNIPSTNSPMAPPRRPTHRRSSSFSSEFRSGEVAYSVEMAPRNEVSRFAAGTTAMSPRSRV